MNFVAKWSVLQKEVSTVDGPCEREMEMDSLDDEEHQHSSGLSEGLTAAFKDVERLEQELVVGKASSAAPPPSLI